MKGLYCEWSKLSWICASEKNLPANQDSYTVLGKALI